MAENVDNYYIGTKRSYFHTFSREISASAQGITQAPFKSGHNTFATDIRGEAVPYIADLSDRDTRILQGTAGSRTVVVEFSSVIKFYDKVTMEVVPGSNNQSWRIKDADTGLYVKGAIDPTDQYDSTGALPSDGYSFQLFAENGTAIDSDPKVWTFSPFTGILYFVDETKVPSTLGYGAIKCECFSYIGKSVGQIVDEIKYVTDHNSDIAIKPFTFTSGSMTLSGASYTESYTGRKLALFTKTVPGFVFEMSTADNNTFVAELNHDSNGDTIVTVEMEVNDSDAVDPAIEFIAFAYVTPEGNKIKLLAASAI